MSVTEKSLAAVIGKSARELRLQADVTLEQLAKAAGRYGLPWTSGRAGDFEAGRASSNLSTIFIAAAALAETTGRPVRLADLIPDSLDLGIRLNKQVCVPAAAIHAALSGDYVRIDSLVDLTGVAELETAEGLLGEHRAELPEWAQGVDRQQHYRVLRDFSEADARLCRKHKISREVGAAAMALLWQETFTARRDQIAGPDANAQKRGQVARSLQVELEEVIRRGDR